MACSGNGNIMREFFDHFVGSAGYSFAFMSVIVYLDGCKKWFMYKERFAQLVCAWVLLTIVTDIIMLVFELIMSLLGIDMGPWRNMLQPGGGGPPGNPPDAPPPGNPPPGNPPNPPPPGNPPDPPPPGNPPNPPPPGNPPNPPPPGNPPNPPPPGNPGNPPPGPGPCNRGNVPCDFCNFIHVNGGSCG